MSEEHGPDDGRGDIVPGADLVQMGKLLHLTDYGTPGPEQITRELRAYWDRLRNGRAVPTRSEVEPHAIRRALDYAFILERIAPGAARFRLAGRHLIDVMGMEVRGMPICALLNTSSRGRFSDVLETVFRGPQIAQLRLRANAGYARPDMSGLLLLMPLRSDLGDVTRALGCLATEGGIGQPPRRFDLLGDQLFPIIPGAQVLEPSASATGSAETGRSWSTAAPPAPLTTPEERRARFRIISNDARQTHSDRPA